MQIAVLIGGIIYDSQKELIRGIIDQVQENHAKAFVFTCGGDIYSENAHSKGEFQIYGLPNWDMFDGVIVAPDTIQNSDVVKRLETELSGLTIPVIVIDGKMGALCSFYVDNEKAVYDMTEHIIKHHGKKKLLYLSGPSENVESAQRLEGFLKCVKEYQLSAHQDYWIEYGNYWTDSGSSIVTECLQKHGVPEAVVCANDYMAIGAIDSLHEAGYRIPEDVIVTGFDDSYDGRYYQPRLTTIAKPLYDMGREACKHLFYKNIEKMLVSFPVKQVLAESCGCDQVAEPEIPKFKAQMLKEKNDNIRWATIMNSLSADLNEMNTFEEFLDRLKFYVRSMNFPFFYLCLCDDKQLMGEIQMVDGIYKLSGEDTTRYTEKIKVTIAYENGQFKDAETIECRALLPRRFFEISQGVLSIVMPIHFQLHCMGYCVIGNSSFPLESIHFQSWVMHLGNGLENIRKQMLMRNMINHLNRMWLYDTMTGVLNRAGFYIKAEEVLAKCRQNREEFLLLFLDADCLKTVNDTYGHEEGDFYIKSIARVCQQYVDTTGIVMRYGGDEFVILKCSSGEDCDEVITSIKKSVCAVREKRKKPYLMDVSVGCYKGFVEDNFKLEAIVDRADRDMYLMKQKKHVHSQKEKGETTK